MSKGRRILLNTTLSLALGTTACMGHRVPFGLCGLSLDPAHCNLAQEPVSIASAVDPKDSVKDSVPEVLKGHGETRLGGAPTWRNRPAKGPPFFVSVGDTILLRVNGWIQYIDEVRWHSTDKSVATVEPVWLDDRGQSVTQAEVAGKKAGIATISVNVSGQRDSVSVTVTPDSAHH